MNPVLVKRKFEERGTRRVKLGFIDMDGVMRGKYINLDKFWSAIERDLGFCDVVLGWDIADALYDNVTFTGWHTGYPDVRAKIDTTTFRFIPWEPDTGFFLLDLTDQQGAPVPIAPRQVLRRVLSQASAAGYTPQFSAEFEFFFFRETPASLRAKNYKQLEPLSPGMFGYSVLRASANAEFVTKLLDLLTGFDVELEGFHTETGPGVYEAAIAVAPGIAGADKAALFKTAIKEIAANHGLIPTFMAKYSAELPGSSGHIHQSLWDIKKGENFFSAKEDMPEVMRHYIAGLVVNLPELMVMMCPTVNSYKRTVPGFWAPVNSTWGIDNRTTAVRAIPSTGDSARIETRLPGADMNPYLAMAASLAAGLDGIERKIELAPATTDAYKTDGALCPELPRDLAEATRLFRSSALAHKAFGDEFVEHYAATREWEVRQYQKAVTDWELARYFEAI